VKTQNEKELKYGMRNTFMCALRLVHTTRTYIRLRNDLYCVEWGVKLYSLLLLLLPVRTARTDVRPVRKKALHAKLFCPYGSYVRVVWTGCPFMSPVILYPF